MQDYTTFTDEMIILEIQKGNIDLFSEIIDRYENKLFRYANNIIRDRDKAVDVVQETFIKAYINLNSFKTTKKFSSWIYRITHNESLNAIKKYHKEIPLPEDVDFKSSDDTEEEFIQKETTEMVSKCLHSIPVLFSEPLSLFFIEEKSYEEISDILQIPMGTVATRISRAKIIMKKICQKN